MVCRVAFTGLQGWLSESGLGRHWMGYREGALAVLLAQQDQVLVCPPPYKPSYKERCATAQAKAKAAASSGGGGSIAAKDEMWKVFLGDLWPTVETSAVIDKVTALKRWPTPV